MAQGPGNPKGPHYGLGKIIVAVSGTPVQLNQVFSFNDPFAKTAVPVTFSQLIFNASPTNTGIILVCFNVAGASGAGFPNSIILTLAPGETKSFLSPLMSAASFSPKTYCIDSTAAGDGCYVSGLA